MATSDQVTPNADYGERCYKIAEERRCPDDVKYAMRHPEFKQRHHKLLDDLAEQSRKIETVRNRVPLLTISMGSLTICELLTAVMAEGFEIGRRVQSQGNWTEGGAGEDHEIELVRVSLADIGLKYGATRQKIFGVATKYFGLRPCQWPREVLIARQAYTDQQPSDRLLVALKPATSHQVLCLSSGESGLAVTSLDSHEKGWFDLDSDWLFERVLEASKNTRLDGARWEKE